MLEEWGAALLGAGEPAGQGSEPQGAGTELTSGSVSPEPAEAVRAGAEQSKFPSRLRRNPGAGVGVGGWSGMGGGDTGERGGGGPSDPRGWLCRLVVLLRSQPFVLS